MVEITSASIKNEELFFKRNDWVFEYFTLMIMGF
jgi:hypothetical protein